MIEWIERLPDWMIGMLAAGGLWFGFNYAVLAERAMEKEQAQSVLPSCLSSLEGHEQKQKSLVPGVGGIGRALGLPELDRLQELMIERNMPRFLSVPEKRERCTCAAKRTAQNMRFDYAVHTASFRIIAPHSVSGMRDQVIELVLSGACGALPQWRGPH